MRLIDANEFKRRIERYDPSIRDVALKELRLTKTVKPKPQWIPATERLPGYCEDVLLKIGAYCAVGYLSPTNDEERSEWYFSGWYHPMSDVTAWMPLPEAYHE